MKKALYILSAAALVFASCDPVSSDKEFEFIKVDDAMLSKSDFISFTQMDKNGNADPIGNYFTYTTNPATIVELYWIKPDGTEDILTKKGPAAAGSFELSPSRGSSADQDVYIRVYNPDNSVATSKRGVTVAVATELPLQMKLLVSDSGTKNWGWNTNSLTVWGNMGYCGGNGEAVELNHEGQWWGVDFINYTFQDQQQHRGGDIVTGDDEVGAYMIWKEDGSITCYNTSGDKIRTGNFEMKEYDANGEWKKGDLKTSAGAILWPYQINTNGAQPETFDVCYLSESKMCLVVGSGDLGGWGEATYWHFYSNSDVPGLIAGYNENAPRTWKWDTAEGLTVWGNMGNCGGSGIGVALNHEGQWWGVDFSAYTFADQQQHRGGEAVTGDDQPDSYMTFNPNGVVRCYSPEGAQIRDGSWKFEPTENNPWKVGDLITSAGAIMWPYAINQNGYQPESFEVLYISDEQLCLFYNNGSEFGSWGESTYWHFRRN